VRDITNLELRRGDRVIDADGTLFSVGVVTPATAHLMNVKTGRKFRSGKQTMLKVPAFDLDKLDSQRKRKHHYYDLTTGPFRRMRDNDRR